MRKFYDFSLMIPLFAAASVAISATAIGAITAGETIDVTPLTHDFGDKAMVAGPGEVLEVTIANGGDDVLNFVSPGIELDGYDARDFQFATPPDLSPIPSGEDRQLKILFCPLNVGSKSAELALHTDAKDAPLVYVSLLGNGTNTAPRANPDRYGTLEDTPLAVDPLGVLANDIDGDGPTFALESWLSSSPNNALHFVLFEDGSFIYIPILDFNGIDSFFYYADDGFDHSEDAEVTINVASVIDPPKLARADSPVKGPTNSRNVEVTIVPAPMPDPPEYVDFSEDPSFAMAKSSPYSGQPAASYTLSSGDGERSIYVRLRNSGGTSAVQAAKVLLDETPPREDPLYPLSLSQAPGTQPEAVDLRFIVGFNEPVRTAADGGTVSGLLADAVRLTSDIDGLKSLNVTVTGAGEKSTGPYQIQVTGDVAEAGTITVGLMPGMILDEAGNAMDTSHIGASFTLATRVRDWTMMK